MSWESKSPHLNWTSIQYLLLVIPSNESLPCSKRQISHLKFGGETYIWNEGWFGDVPLDKRSAVSEHGLRWSTLYEEKRRISAQELQTMLEVNRRVRGVWLTNSFCNFYGDELSPFVRSRFATLPFLDRRLDTRTESISTRRWWRANNPPNP
jgi:hypothetical protein